MRGNLIYFYLQQVLRMFSCFSLRTVLHQRNVNAGVTKCRKRTISHVKGSSCNVQDRKYLARAVFLMLLLCFLAAAISLENHNQQICSLISLYYEFVFGCICLSVFVFDHLRESPKSWPDNDSPSERSPIVPGRERFQSQTFSQLLLRHFYPLLYFCLPIFQEKTLSRVFFLLKARVLSHNFNVTVSKCQEDRLAICICCVLWALEIFRNLD